MLPPMAKSMMLLHHSVLFSFHELEICEKHQ